MRKLVTVRKIDDIQPIEGADAIEVATVGGWKVVTKKGQFNVGDLAIYFEIDSFLPNWPEFSFLKDLKTFEGKEGFRLRTVRLRKQLSQGLLLPFSDFAQFDNIRFEEGQDITEYLDVVKWEPPVSGGGNNVQRKGTFPHFIRKTDEERVQNISLKELNQYKDDWFVETIKLDGSSMTVYIHGTEDYNDEGNKEKKITLGVCSRNQEVLDTPGNQFWEQAKLYNLPDRLGMFHSKYGRSIAIQGELFGEGIQKNPWKLKGRQFAIFNIFCIDEQRYFYPSEVFEIIEELNLYNVEGQKLQHVPITRQGILSEMFELKHDAILARADEIYDLVPERPTEGFVYKLDSKTIPYYSFKAISNKYLEKTGG